MLGFTSPVDDTWAKNGSNGLPFLLNGPRGPYIRTADSEFITHLKIH